MHWIDTSPGSRIEGLNPLPGVTNYLLGREKRDWHTAVPHFQRIEYRGIYRGTDLIFHGNGNQLEFDFNLAPGSRLEEIQFTISGSAGPHLDASGNLLIRAAGRSIQFHKPRIYQQMGKTRLEISGGYVRRGGGTFGFFAENYDHSKPLVIDPTITITYSTLLGGLGDDQANGVAVDPSGNVYVGGTTTGAATFPESGSTRQGVGGGLHDLFFAKINTSASGAASLDYLTFIGGDADEGGGYVAVDAQGNLAFFGSTTSLNFPVTDQSFFRNGPTAGVVGKLNPSGSSLSFATYLDGGDGAVMTQLAGGIALDSTGDIYVATDTTSTQLPVSTGAFQATYGGGLTDGLLAKFDPTGVLLYLSYFGINAKVVVSGIALDSAGAAYITGSTTSPAKSGFPAQNAFQTVYGGGVTDAFVLSLNPAGAGAADLIFATLLGGSDADQGLAIAVDSANPPNAYVTGLTRSTNFPTGGATPAFNAKSAGSLDAFLVSLSSGASGPLQLNYSTYLGGSKDDSGTAITALSASAVYVAGRTASLDFPVSGSLQAFSGLGDVFLSKFDVTSAGASSLVYSTLLAGTTSDEPHALAADTSGGLYLAGTAHSSDYPLAPHPSNGFQLAWSNCGIATGSNDAFLTKLIENLPPTPIVSFSAPNMNFGLVAVGTSSNPKHVNLINSGAAALNVLSTVITGMNSGDFSILASGSACPTGVFQLAPGAQCSLTVVFTPSAGTAESASLDINDTLAGSPQSLPLLGSGSAPVAQISPASIDFGSVPIGAAGNGGTVTITNGGNIALILTEIKVTGANSSDFASSGNPTGDTCPVAPGSLASGASCSVHIVFQPLAPGARNAELDISDNSANIAGSLQKVFLSGTGTPSAPVASIFPTSHDFGGVPVGTTTLQAPVTLTNTGSLTLNISNIQISGNPDFSFAGAPIPACPLGAAGQLSPNSSCNLTAAFHPTSAGIETAQITFTDNSGGTAGTSQAMSLTGTGVSPAVSVTPSALTISPQLVGTTSAANPITVKNTGNAALTFQTSIGGSNATDFSEADTCQGSIAAGASCNLMVTFAPKEAGSRNALLFVTATNVPPSNNQQTVPLGGAAVDFSLGAAPGSSTSVSVAAGQAATFNLQLNPINGFSGTVAITCAGAPVSSTCSAAPSSINATGNSAIPFAVNIATSASRLGIPADRPAAPVIPKNWVIVIFLILLLCLLLVSAKRRRRSLIAFAPAAAFALVLLMTSGCGGGSGSAGAGNAGPARGTFTIVVTGAAQGGSRNVALSLTIQ